MKHLLSILLLTIVLYSCGNQYKCYPSKKSRDYAVRQWMKQRSDGYWIVYTTRGMLKETATVFECKPDSMQLEKLKSGKPI